LRSRIAANQASAVGSLRTINTAEATFSSTFNTGYSLTLSALRPTATATPTTSAAGLIDSILALGNKSGYTFTYGVAASDATGNVTAYNLHPAPSTAGTTGQKDYFSDQTAVIRQNTSAAASATDAPIGG
jgi:hypothetical protein